MNRKLLYTIVTIVIVFIGVVFYVKQSTHIYSKPLDYPLPGISRLKIQLNSPTENTSNTGRQNNSENTTSPNSDSTSDTTDVFSGYILGKVDDASSTSELGQRYRVQVAQHISEVQQIGNVNGIVIVNDPNSYIEVLKYGHTFYTKYDSKHSWYTILRPVGFFIND